MPIRWKTVPFPLCMLDVPVADLAIALGLPLLQWEEDGLGEAVGLALELPPNMPLLLHELAHAREHLGAKGPTVHVDAQDLVRHGVQALAAAALARLGLAPENLAWSQSDDGLAEARRLLAGASRNCAPSEFDVQP